MSEFAARGIGIDFGAGVCRVVAVEGTSYQVICDFEVPMRPVATRPSTLLTPTQLGHDQPTMSHRFQSESIKRHMGMDRSILYGRETLSNDEAATRILRELKEKSEEKLNGIITGVAVAVPPCFTDRQNAATKYCAEAAGFRDVVLVDDSRAAVLAYSSESQQRGKWLVYGLGKSIFFVTVLDTAEGIKPLAHNGNVHLGGDEFDALIVDEAIKRGILDRLGISSSDTRVGTALLQFAERHKVLLSSQEQATVEEALSDAHSRPIPVNFTFTRNDFERLIAGHVEETMRLAEQTVKEAGLTLEEIDRVLLLGRSTQIPLVQHKLRRMLGKTIEPLPDDRIARGAAIYATRLGECFSREAKAIPHASQTLTTSSPQSIVGAPPQPAVISKVVDLPVKLADCWMKVQIAYRTGALDEAIATYEEFLTAAQEDLSYIYNQRAAQLKGQGKEQEAIDLLQRGYKRFPENPILARKLSDLHAEIALACFQSALHEPNRRESYLDKCNEHIRISLKYNENNLQVINLRTQLDNNYARSKKYGRR